MIYLNSNDRPACCEFGGRRRAAITDIGVFQSLLPKVVHGGTHAAISE